MLKWINKKRNQKGFTLIELIVVIAILGILAALAIPKLTGTRDTANRKAVVASLRAIESALTIAEAEGKAVTSIGTTGDATSLVALGYLASNPTGPGAVTYTLVGGRAAAVLTVNMFGATNPVGNNTLDTLLGNVTWMK